MQKGVTHELMSEEEDVEDDGGFKVKTPVWHSTELSNLVKVLDKRRENTLRSLKQTGFEKIPKNFGLSNEGKPSRQVPPMKAPID